MKTYELRSPEDIAALTEEWGFLPFSQGKFPAFPSRSAAHRSCGFQKKRMAHGNGKGLLPEADAAYMGNSSAAGQALSAGSGFPTLPISVGMDMTLTPVMTTGLRPARIRRSITRWPSAAHCSQKSSSAFAITGRAGTPALTR